MEEILETFLQTKPLRKWTSVKIAMLLKHSILMIPQVHIMANPFPLTGSLVYQAMQKADHMPKLENHGMVVV